MYLAWQYLEPITYKPLSRKVNVGEIAKENLT